MTGTRRRTARGAAVATAVLLGGMIPGAQAASGMQEIDAELAYTCDFPGGEQPVKVGIAASVPESAQPGQTIQPEDMALDVTLPEGAFDGHAGSTAATVAAELRLSVDIAQGDQHAQAEWIGTTAEPTRIPDKGGLTLSTSGSVPYVKPGGGGSLSMEAGGLSGVFTTKTSEGLPTEPGTTDLTCAPDPGQEVTLATLDIGDAGGEPAPEPTVSAAWPDGDEDRGRTLVPEVGTRAEDPAPGDAPPCVGDSKDEWEMVTYVAGYANVTKLNGANKFPVACARIHQYESDSIIGPPETHVFIKASMVLEYGGKPQLPPTTGTFLTFGFMPTTATLEMTQIPPKANSKEDANVNSHLIVDWLDGFKNTTVTTVDVDFVLRLRDVKVNGTPLEVGDNCRTERPFRLSLVGKGVWAIPEPLEGYTLVSGGPLTGSATIPPFAGCGVDEDLDSLFTASLSGSPGFVKQIQGAPCVSFTGAGCTPENQPLDIPKATR
ncbi:DUF6801 domain-containing protein [Streptomyces sp. NPDC005790]|uniref:DUF6801 domain-containing protein n=1 Tax=Streptomyces sp. NPDC005790 TaxID=3154777 RepID=UPI0033F73363